MLTNLKMIYNIQDMSNLYINNTILYIRNLSIYRFYTCIVILAPILNRHQEMTTDLSVQFNLYRNVVVTHSTFLDPKNKLK